VESRFPLFPPTAVPTSVWFLPQPPTLLVAASAIILSAKFSPAEQINQESKYEDVFNNKRKRGQRGCNKISSDVVYVTKLDSNGLPYEPPEVRKVFKRASGF
jgi:hypothetical protein